ncbi:hypothetical protein AAFO92_19305 [Roseovarius sp. CAU 1744]|uniref:hypothetical protein n=1 Tax=Roseovarius sp. CAU 1744 TaxID=3140368 RepID=UPI00325B0FF7
MNTNEMLIRTMNAAKDAREKGFLNTAEALDEIGERLLGLLESHAQSQSDYLFEASTELHHMH